MIPDWPLCTLLALYTLLSSRSTRSSYALLSLQSTLPDWPLLALLAHRALGSRYALVSGRATLPDWPLLALLSSRSTLPGGSLGSPRALRSLLSSDASLSGGTSHAARSNLPLITSGSRMALVSLITGCPRRSLIARRATVSALTLVSGGSLVSRLSLLAAIARLAHRSPVAHGPLLPGKTWRSGRSPRALRPLLAHGSLLPGKTWRSGRSPRALRPLLAHRSGGTGGPGRSNRASGPWPSCGTCRSLRYIRPFRSRPRRHRAQRLRRSIIPCRLRGGFCFGLLGSGIYLKYGALLSEQIGGHYPQGFRRVGLVWYGILGGAQRLAEHAVGDPQMERIFPYGLVLSAPGSLLVEAVPVYGQPYLVHAVFGERRPARHGNTVGGRHDNRTQPVLFYFCLAWCRKRRQGEPRGCAVHNSPFTHHTRAQDLDGTRQDSSCQDPRGRRGASWWLICVILLVIVLIVLILS